MSMIFSRALHMASKLPCHSLRSFSLFNFSSIASLQNLSPPFLVSRPCQSFHLIPYLSKIRTLGGPCASVRGFRKSRRRLAAKKQLAKEKQLELDVKICIEEEMPDDPEVLSIAEMLRLNVPMAMKIALEGLKDSEYKTRDTAIDDVGGFEKVELSVLLCNDDFIRKLNKEWRDEDHATDVLSMPQHIPGFDLPILMLGDIVISVETAARQAEERGHALIDEIRILLVHGLLHLLGFDHEKSDEAEEEMEKEEELVLKSLGWKGKGLIHSAYDALTDESPQTEKSAGEATKNGRKQGTLRFYKPKFSYIFCDMDGTLLNSKSQVTLKTAEALREAISRGVRVVIATGKTHPAVISALKMVDLAGKDGVISESSPGIFLQRMPPVGRLHMFTVKQDGAEAPPLFSAIWLVVKYKHMMPAAALEYVRSRRPRVLLAPAQWQESKLDLFIYFVPPPYSLSTTVKCYNMKNSLAVQDYCKYWMESAAKQIELGKSTSVSTFMTSADKVLFSSSSSTLTAFADEVLITEADLEGYSTCEVRNDSSRELSIPCRAVRGRAMLTRLSCLFTSLKASGGSSSITGRLLEIRAC